VLVVFFVDVTRLLPAVARVVVSCKTITLFMLLWLWSGGINSDSRSHKESGKAEWAPKKRRRTFLALRMIHSEEWKRTAITEAE
jgi:hypothetical protein